MKKAERKSLEKLKKSELTRQAKALGLKGIARVNKPELIDLILETREKAETPVTTEPSGEREIASREEAIVEGESPKNDIAIQHPSASPSALQYGRLTERGGEPAAPPSVWPDRERIPENYGRDRLTLLVRDPQHLFAFWEISAAKLKELSEKMSEPKWVERRMVLNVFVESEGAFDLLNSIGVFSEVGRYHIEVEDSDRDYRVEIGFEFQDGEYVSLLSSALVHAPRDAREPDALVRWMTVEPSGMEAGRRTFEKTSAESPLVGAGKLRAGLERAVESRRRELGIPAGPLPSDYGYSN